MSTHLHIIQFKKYVIANCEKIHSLSSKDSWIVPLNILDRDILLHTYFAPGKPKRRRYKRRHRVGKSFQTRKNKYLYVRTLSIKELHGQIKMPHKYCCF